MYAVASQHRQKDLCEDWGEKLKLSLPLPPLPRRNFPCISRDPPFFISSISSTAHDESFAWCGRRIGACINWPGASGPAPSSF